MAEAGGYDERFQWQRANLGAPNGVGQKAREYTAGGFLWGTAAAIAADEQSYGGGERQRTAATIRVRNHVPVKPQDVLHSAEWGESWRVMTVTRGDNETVLGVERFGS